MKIKFEETVRALSGWEQQAEELAKRARNAEEVVADARRASEVAYLRWKLDTDYDEYLTLGVEEQAFVTAHLDDLGTVWTDSQELLVSARDVLTHASGQKRS